MIVHELGGKECEIEVRQVCNEIETHEYSNCDVR